MEVVAMDGFSGSKSTAAEELAAAVTVMDPFQFVRLAGAALDDCLHRIQQATCGPRGHAGGSRLYKARRTLPAGEGLLTEKQQKRIEDLFAAEKHIAVEATWGAYRRVIHAYQDQSQARGRRPWSSSSIPSNQ